jgi:hypothetical protein
MNQKYLLIGVAFALPALLLPLSSCSDSSDTAVAPNVPDVPATPSAPRRSFGLTDHKILLPQLSAAQEAEALRMDAAEANLVIASNTGSFAPHDPVLTGQRVRCIDGSEFGFPPGRSDPFRNQGDVTRGCEVNTMNGGAAIVLPSSNSTRGKLVRNTRRLEFFYAGGPQNGGAPRFSLFTDYCRDASGNPVTNMSSCSTNGTWDETLFIDQSNCNNGDPFVGALRLKSEPNSASDPDCPVFEAFGFDGVSNTGDEHVHTNWFDYIGAHPRDRFARNFGPPDFAQANNFIIADVPVHYLVYRVRMVGGDT